METGSSTYTKSPLLIQAQNLEKTAQQLELFLESWNQTIENTRATIKEDNKRWTAEVEHIQRLLALFTVK